MSPDDSHRPPKIVNSSPLESLLIRADSSTATGSGHIMRCMALAQAWKAKGGNATFISFSDSAPMRSRLEDEGFTVIEVEKPHPHPGDWKTFAEVLEAHPDSPVVLDGYHFDTGYQARIKDSGHRSLVIDDIAHLKRYHADLVLNQNINAVSSIYACDPGTVFLLGPRYALLRSEFYEQRNRGREIPDAALRIMVVMGGSDPDNITLKVLQTLKKLDLPGLDVRIVAGPANPHQNSLREAIGTSGDSFRLAADVRDMPALMAWADLAVSGSGSTCWEMAFMGLPAVVFSLADNQVGIAKGLHELGIVVNLGPYGTSSGADLSGCLRRLIHDREMRREMCRRGRELVDGCGPERVADALSGRQ